MKIKLTLSYDGTNYCGWQRQKNKLTVQESVENAVFFATGEKTTVTASGRTDAGVHAAGQVAEFNTSSNIPPEKFYKALNVYLPNDVKILSSEKAEDGFHAVKSAKKKTYEYSFYLSEVPLPLKERYALCLDRRPNLSKMKKTASLLIGEHDFKAFSATGSSAKTTVRTIYGIEITENGDEIKIAVTGNGFLYNMVRIIAGTLLRAGYGDVSENDVSTALISGDRKLLGKTLPAKGLCLKSVIY